MFKLAPSAGVHLKRAMTGLGNTVRIILNEPLLKGLQWELSFPVGTFTDEAGNKAPAQAEGTYVFWSPGAQKPVIRVDRRSYDARTSAWHVPTTGNNASGYTHANPAAGSGWSLSDFVTVKYRIESETPYATIYYGFSKPDNSTEEDTGSAFDAITAAWTGDVANVGNPAPTGYTQVAWDAISSQARVNQWVRPNLINRGGNGTGTAQNSYTVNGVTRVSAGNLRLLRSYNRDATVAILEKLVEATPITGQASTNSYYKSSFGFDPLEAGKRYVAAVARKNHGVGNDYYSARGYEGVFRTLIMLQGQSPGNNQNTARDRIVVEGSNIKNGMPSVAGFPVQDAAESGDSRFVKMMYNNGGTSNFTWVSTEIVCEWYFLYFGGGASHVQSGEVNNYMMVGYGDLTFVRNLGY